MERHHRVDENQFLDGIDFGGYRRGDILGRFIADPVGRHFLDSASATAELVRERFPDCVDKTIDLADAVCRHEFRLLGRIASFQEAIDWFWIPDTDERWPVVSLDQFASSFYNDADRPGDVKYPWELNRHQYFLTLAKADLFTGNLKYSDELQHQLSDWQSQNPFRTGINWYSSLELAIRLISWTNTIALLRGASRPNAELVQQLLYGAYQHAHYLDRTLTTHWLVANNHLVGETAGLFAFATTFPEFRASSRWRDRALRILTAALDQQIFSDGVNREQATGYHRFVLDFLVLVDRLAALNGIEMPERFNATLRAMMDYEAAVDPQDGGTAPAVGDCDDGRGLALSESAELLDFGGWLPYGAVRFENARLASASKTCSEESAWLLGTEGLRRYDSIKCTEPPQTSAAFSEGGHYVLRAGTVPETAYVFVRSGPFGLGEAGSSVHSHGDLLAPVIHWRGRALAVDSGTYGYLCSAEERDRLRGGAAHNTFLPANQDQGELQSLWNWSEVPSAEVLSWSDSTERTTFRGRVRAPAGFRHERAITLERSPLTLTIEDDLAFDNGAHAIWRLHLASGLAVERLDAESMRIYDDAGFVVVMHFSGFSGHEIFDDAYARHYGIWERARCIKLTTTENPARGRVVFRDPSDATPKPGKG